MKTLNTALLNGLCLFMFIIFFTSVMEGQELSPQQEETLYKHMLEINAEWKHYKSHLSSINEPIVFSSDEERIQMHLKLVTTILQKKVTNHLTTNQLKDRVRLLAELEGYFIKSIFPQNNSHAIRQPYFVDHAGRACAVGYLMLSDGQTDLVKKIQEEDNNAFVEDLVQVYHEVIEWANNNGFTKEELAWIQPGYLPVDQNWLPVGNGGGANGQINVMKATLDDTYLYIAGDFDSVDNVNCNNIIAWDGMSWHTLGEGINGEVLAMDVNEDGDLYVVGDFTLISNPDFSNIAKWNGENWEGLQSGEMEGEVRTILVDGDQLYIGGNFQKVNNQDMSYLAYYAANSQSNTEWSNSVTISVGNGNYETVAHAFSVDAPVNEIIKVGDDEVLVAGDFQFTAPTMPSNNVNTLETDFAAFWDGTNWTSPVIGITQPVSTTGVFYDDVIYFGGSQGGEEAFSIYADNSITHRELTILEEGDSTNFIYGFIEDNGRVFAYGNINHAPLSMVLSSGFIQVSAASNVWNVKGGLFDKRVRSCESFQGNIYFAGDFTSPNNGNTVMNGLTYSDLSSPIIEINEVPIEIYTYRKQLYLHSDYLRSSLEVTLYNIEGQKVYNKEFTSEINKQWCDLNDLASGIYFYEITSGTERKAGKLSLF